MGSPTSGDFEAAGPPERDFDLPQPGYQPQGGYVAGPYVVALPADPYRGASARPDRGEIIASLAVAVVVAVLGFPLGALWSSAAPWLPAVQGDNGPVYADPEGEQLIAAEGWYLIITVLAGIVFAVLAWMVLRRYRGALQMLALGVGSVAAGILAFWFGHHIGLAHARDLADHAPANTRFPIPPNLRVQQIGLWHGFLPYAKGDVLALAIAAVLTYLVLAGFSPHPTLRRPDLAAAGWAPAGSGPAGGVPGP
ncbi:MAG: hypothetical protein J2P15_12715, partial [Micromonosporaceae bacterium]|nr:hypothetical protein [Micromonosporaceae bacterium]